MTPNRFVLVVSLAGAIVAGTSKAQNVATESRSDFCEDIRYLVRIAPSDFGAIRGTIDRDLSDSESATYIASRALPNAKYCYIDVDKAAAHESSYRCTWRFDTLQKGQAAFQGIVVGLRECDLNPGHDVRTRASNRSVSYYIKTPEDVAVSVRFSTDRDGNKSRISFSVSQWRGD